MKSNNYPWTTSSFTDDERAKFHRSLEIDFDLNALIAKLKILSSRASSLDDLNCLHPLLRDLHDIVDQYQVFYAPDLNPLPHNETEN